MPNANEKFYIDWADSMKRDIAEAKELRAALARAAKMVHKKYSESCVDWRRNLVEDVIVLAIADTKHMIADWEQQLAKMEHKDACGRCGSMVPLEQITYCQGVGLCHTCYYEHTKEADDEHCD